MGIKVNVEFLKAFGNAWNNHDIDELMSYMDENCIFQGSMGPKICGSYYEGFDNVREGYQKMLDTFPDGTWTDDTHFIADNQGVSEWTFRGTSPDGSKIEIRGCDILTFRNGKISIKNSFRKIKV
jgi:ketosteroid isomerase-like protein